MVRLFNLLLVCSTSFLAGITLAEAQGLKAQGAGVEGARFGQGSGSRGGCNRGSCCCEEPEPQPEPGAPVECNPQCPSAHDQIFRCDGRTYKQFCGLHVATDTLSSFGVSSYQECFNSCVQETKCHALDYTDNHCWLKTQGIVPPAKVMPKDQDISIVFL